MSKLSQTKHNLEVVWNEIRVDTITDEGLLALIPSMRKMTELETLELELYQ
mgnify:CR=1 FL=1